MPWRISQSRTRIWNQIGKKLLGYPDHPKRMYLCSCVKLVFTKTANISADQTVPHNYFHIDKLQNKNKKKWTFSRVNIILHNKRSAWWDWAKNAGDDTGLCTCLQNRAPRGSIFQTHYTGQVISFSALEILSTHFERSFISRLLQ